MLTQNKKSANTVQDNNAQTRLSPEDIQRIFNPTISQQIAYHLDNIFEVFQLKKVVDYVNEMYIASVESGVDHVSLGPNMWKVNAQLKYDVCNTLPRLHHLYTEEANDLTEFENIFSGLFDGVWDITDFEDYLWRMYVDALGSGIMETYKPNQRTELAMIVKILIDSFKELYEIWHTVEWQEAA